MSSLIARNVDKETIKQFKAIAKKKGLLLEPLKNDIMTEAVKKWIERSIKELKQGGKL